MNRLPSGVLGEKNKIGEPGEQSALWGLLSELDFNLRPIPHLGACSQAIVHPKLVIGRSLVRLLLGTLGFPFITSLLLLDCVY